MLYELIPTMPEVRLLPLIERFTRMLAEFPVFADTFGAIWGVVRGPMAAQDFPSLYERLGGVYNIATVVDNFVDLIYDRSPPECEPEGRRGLSIEREEIDLIADYGAAIAAEPKSATAFLGRGEAHQAKNDLDLAIADYGKALELDNKLVAAYGNRARAYRADGDLDKALADFDEAMKLEPRSALAHVDRGVVYQAKGDLDRAIADYDEAIELDPKYVSAFLNRATAYREKRSATTGGRAVRAW